MASWAGTIDDCNAEAENDNPGRSITVKLGSVTQITTSDIDAVQQAVAQHHDDPTLNLLYNSAGRAALRQAMDCMFDAEMVTLSTAWMNNDPDLDVRTYGVAVFNSSNQLQWTGQFASLDQVSSVPFLHFDNDASAECVALEVVAHGAHDYGGNFTNSAKLSGCKPDQNCTRCRKGGAGCECKIGNGGCNQHLIAGDDGNGAIIRVTGW